MMKQVLINLSFSGLVLLFSTNLHAKECIVQLNVNSMGNMPLMRIELQDSMTKFRIFDETNTTVFSGKYEEKIPTKGNYVTNKFSKNFNGFIKKFTFTLTPNEKQYFVNGLMALNIEGKVKQSVVSGLVYGCEK